MLSKNKVYYLLQILKRYLDKVEIINNELNLYLTNVSKLKIVIFILKNHFLFLNSSLIDIVVVDYPKKKKRFKISYQFLSIKYNNSIKVCAYLNELDSIDSLTDYYESANWLERECWDTFGVFFKNHNDLRRILTDYGFEGFPFKKDFPINGYVEVRYDDEKKKIVWEPLEITQEFRFFKFISPWTVRENAINFKTEN